MRDVLYREILIQPARIGYRVEVACMTVMSQEISDFRFVCFGIGLIRAKVRTVERSVEGLHSLVKRALQRSPAAKISYLSMELRYPQLLHFAMADPACIGEMSRKMADIVTLRGLRRAILQPD